MAIGEKDGGDAPFKDQPQERQGCPTAPHVRDRGAHRQSWTEHDYDELADEFPGFEILCLLGRGGMGAVYKARQLGLERFVAIKVLPVELQADSDFATRFVEEARILAQLQHPNIVTVHDFGWSRRGRFYFVMAFVGALDLSVLIRERRLSPMQILQVSRQVCRALSHAHSRGIVHRDVKPGNILVDEQFDVRVADFGIAALCFPGAESWGDIAGSPGYMAPEQAEGRIDYRSDIYSLGAVLYAMLTGHPPQGSVALPPSQATAVDPCFDAIVMKSLEKNPEDRFPSMDALGAELGRLAAVGVREYSPGILRTAVLLYLRPISVSQAIKQSEEWLQECAVFIRDTVQGDHPVWAMNGGVLCTECTSATAAVLQVVELQQSSLAAVGATLASAIHWGEFRSVEDEPGQQWHPVGDAVEVGRLLALLAAPRQILTTTPIFDSARTSLRESLGWRNPDGTVTSTRAAFRAHGRYLFAGREEPIAVFEIGLENVAPLNPPDGGNLARRFLDADEEATLGWRPAAEQPIRNRPEWVLQKQLGVGGFGEVWLAVHQQSKDQRVFKFCFDPERMRSFRRELALFRLIRDQLGDRPDFARLTDVSVQSPPFFVQSEYYPAGNLAEWAQSQGGIGNVPMERRLEIFAQICRAVAAAHSLGIIHRDLKPSNVLMSQGLDERFVPRLADFGIGSLEDRSRLDGQHTAASAFDGTLLTKELSARTGTRIYTPPEYLTGARPSLQGDVYALGVFLYQLAVGNLQAPLAEGWRRDISDPLVAEDISAAVEGDISRRLSSADLLADRISSLPARQQARNRRRKTKMAVAALAVAAALPVPLGIAFYRERAARLAQEKAEARNLILRHDAETAAESAHTAASAAEKARAKAEQLIDASLTNLRMKLQPLGRLEFLEDLAHSSSDYFKEMEPANLSPSGRLQYVRTRLLNGQIALTTGQAQEAATIFAETEKMAKEFWNATPSSPEEALALADLVAARAGLAASALNLPDARRAVSEALAILKRVELSSDPRHQRTLAAAYAFQGDILIECDDPAGARDAYTAALRVTDQAISRSPADIDLQLDRIAEKSKLAQCELPPPGEKDVVRLAKARKLVEDCLAELKPLKDTEKGRTDLEYSYGHLQYFRGFVLLQEGQAATDRTRKEQHLSAAGADLQDCRAIVSKYMELEPASIALPFEVAEVDSALGELAWARENFVEAVNYWTQSWKAKYALAGNNRPNQDWQLKTFQTIALLIHAAQDRGNLQDCLDWSERGTKLYHAQPIDFQKLPTWRNRFLFCLLAHIQASVDSNLPEGKKHADALWEEALRVQQELEVGGKLDSGNRASLGKLKQHFPKSREGRKD